MQRSYGIQLKTLMEIVNVLELSRATFTLKLYVDILHS